jgi:hypothetical protein
MMLFHFLEELEQLYDHKVVFTIEEFEEEVHDDDVVYPTHNELEEVLCPTHQELE